MTKSRSQKGELRRQNDHDCPKLEYTAIAAKEFRLRRSSSENCIEEYFHNVALKE